MRLDRWTDQHRDLLREWWPKHSAGEIGERLGRTKHAIESQAYVMKLPPKKQNTEWKEEDAETAIEMRNNGFNSAQIGDALNKTRNSVVGFLNRRGIKSPTILREKREKQPPRMPRTPLPKPRPLPPTRNNVVHLLYRTNEQCAYILDEHHIMCGAQTTDKSSSWCAYHKEIVFRKEDAA